MRYVVPMALGLAAFSTACATVTPDDALLAGRIPQGVPTAFEPLRDDLRVAGADTLAGTGCLNPLVDPRDGARLTLVRSWSIHGDYEPPAAGVYGVRAGEVLRLECNTGRVVGIARR